MKIILSPSKTLDFKRKELSIPLTKPFFSNQTNELLTLIRSLTKDQMKGIMGISDKILEEVYAYYHETNSSTAAILAYTGFVYKELNVLNYNEEKLDYLIRHVRILSALYGVLKPTDEITPYRLDLTMKLTKTPLTHYWSTLVTDYFKDEDLIINLASQEFSQLVTKPMVTIEFLEDKDGQLKNVSTYSKKARGMMLHYLITNQITTLEGIKSFNQGQYLFNEELSTLDKIVFTR